MKKYCRYCSFCIYGDVCYCAMKKIIISDEQAKRVNKCKDFDFNPIDVFDHGRRYNPRDKKTHEKKIEQLKLF